MAEVPKVSGVGLSLTAKQAPLAAPTATDSRETGDVTEASPFVERRYTADRRQAKPSGSRPPFDTRQKAERRQSGRLDVEA